MSARGKRSGAAAERRPGLPIDEIPIALKGRNRRRLVLFGCVFFDRSRHSMAHCEVPHGSPARSDIDDLVGPRPCIRSGICCALSGLHDSIPFATQGDAAARGTRRCLPWADMLRPFQGDSIRMSDENQSSARHGNAMPRKSQMKYGGQRHLGGGVARSFLSLVWHVPRLVRGKCCLVFSATTQRQDVATSVSPHCFTRVRVRHQPLAAAVLSSCETPSAQSARSAIIRLVPHLRHPICVKQRGRQPVEHSPTQPRNVSQDH
jgi:hypothetical protein